MAGFKLVITQEAETDIREARQWYERQARLGEPFVTSVEEQLERIEHQPLGSPVVAHGIRRVVVRRFPYNIYYKINGPYVHILAVWHSRKNRESLFS